jgi:hypothetical protein
MYSLIVTSAVGIISGQWKLQQLWRTCERELVRCRTLLETNYKRYGAPKEDNFNVIGHFWKGTVKLTELFWRGILNVKVYFWNRTVHVTGRFWKRTMEVIDTFWNGTVHVMEHFRKRTGNVMKNFRRELSTSWKTSGENCRLRGKLPEITINVVGTSGENCRRRGKLLEELSTLWNTSGRQPLKLFETTGREM